MTNPEEHAIEILYSSYEYKYGMAAATLPAVSHAEEAAFLADVEPGDDVTLLTIRWKETGGPPVQLPIRRSLGTQLIEGFIRFELDGKCQLNFPETGADHTFSFPLVQPTHFASHAPPRKSSEPADDASTIAPHV